MATQPAKPASETDSKKSGTIDQNPEELKYQRVDIAATNRGEWNFDSIKFVHAAFGNLIIKQADETISQLRDTLGKNPMKPRVAGILDMFNEAMRKKSAQDFLPIVEEIRNHTAGSTDDLLKMKYTFEQGAHKNENTFMVNSLKGGSGVETAVVNWQYAVNLFNEARQNAEAIFKEAVYAARKANKNTSTDKSTDLETIINFHVDFFTEASAVATAVDTYGSNMTKANASLIKAYSDLLTELQKNWNQIAQGETKLLVDNRKDSLTLWTALKTFYSKMFGTGRS